MIKQMTKSELKENVVKGILGINNTKYRTLIMFNLSNLDSVVTDIESDWEELDNTYNLIRDNEKMGNEPVFNYSNHGIVASISKVKHTEDGKCTQLQFTYSYKDIKCTKYRVLTFQKNYYSYDLTFCRNFPPFAIDNNIILDNSEYNAGFMNVQSDMTLPDDGLVYLLITEKGAFFYIEEDGDKYDYRNFFNKNKYASYYLELRRYEGITDIDGDPTSRGYLRSMDNIAEEVYTRSSIARETVKYDDDYNIIKCNNHLMGIKLKDNAIYINDRPATWIVPEEMRGIMLKRDISPKEYQFGWKYLFDLGTKNDTIQWTSFAKDSAIYNMTRNEVTWLFTMDSVFKRSIQILKESSKNECDKYTVTYKDASGIEFTVIFTYSDDIEKYTFMVYKDNDYSLQYFPNEKTIKEYKSDFINEDSGVIKFRNIFGMPIHNIPVE